MSILDGPNEPIAGHGNHDFLNAAMACSALATQADGKITLCERYRIDGIVARLERLGIYDPHEIAQILDGFPTELRDNPETARGGPASQTQAHRRRPQGSRIVRIALSVCHSDGGLSASKRVLFAKICAVLGYAPGCFLGERRPGE